MRIFSILSAIFLGVIIFLTINAEAESCQYENFTVEKEQDLIFENEDIWLCGDILIDGHLVIKDSNLNVNRTLDLTTSEIRINPGGQLDIINTTITTSRYTLSDNISTAISPFTLVSDAGNLSIYDSTIYYGMIWLVGGNADITGLALDGFSMINYGIFSEDTNLTASGVNIRNYTLGLRSIGSEPDLESIYYYNCSTRMTQEWWITFSALESSTNLPIEGFEVRQWNGEMLVGSWNWAKQYEIDSSGQILDYQARFTFYLNLGFGYVEKSWEGYIDDNTDIIESFDLNHSKVIFESGTLFVDESQYIIGEKAPKFSNVNFSVSIFNPTDINFNNLYVNLFINNKVTSSRSSISLTSNSTQITNVTWIASKEGPLSISVESVVVDSSDNSTDDYTISLNRFIEIESVDDFSKSDGSWLGLFAIFAIMSLCSYIIYNGMEDEVPGSPESDDKINTTEEIGGDEDKREMAIPDEASEED
tara:strand:- start:222 stop:1652 length:1431 start_codon:yes stop_codon:yes gene_type:complete